MVEEDGKLTATARAFSGWSSRALLDEFIDNDCLPIRDNKELRTWFKITHTGAIYVYKARENQSHVLSVIRNVGTVEKTAGFLKHMGFEFDYPKPISLIEYVAQFSNNKAGTVCDYFGGSGTTAHAVINVNKHDDGTRKYILVEMGEYFDSVLKPRLQKVIYSKDWKDGRSVSRQGSSHAFKVRLPRPRRPRRAAATRATHTVQGETLLKRLFLLRFLHADFGFHRDVAQAHDLRGDSATRVLLSTLKDRDEGYGTDGLSFIASALVGQTGKKVGNEDIKSYDTNVRSHLYRINERRPAPARRSCSISITFSSSTTTAASHSRTSCSSRRGRTWARNI